LCDLAFTNYLYICEVMGIFVQSYAWNLLWIGEFVSVERSPLRRGGETFLFSVVSQICVRILVKEKQVTKEEEARGEGEIEGRVTNLVHDIAEDSFFEFWRGAAIAIVGVCCCLLSLHGGVIAK
jgi:hypothetical protein